MQIDQGVLFVDGKEWRPAAGAGAVKPVYNVTVHVKSTQAPLHVDRGSIVVEGDCVAATTRDGAITVHGQVSGSVTTRDGAVSITGAVTGPITTRDGSVVAPAATPRATVTQQRAKPMTMGGGKYVLMQGVMVGGSPFGKASSKPKGAQAAAKRLEGTRDTPLKIEEVKDDDR